MPSICSLASQVIDLIRTTIPALAALAVLLFMVNSMQYVRRTAQGKRHSDMSSLWWGLVAIIVLFSLWGIIGFLKNNFFPNDSNGGGTAPCSIQTTTSQTTTLNANNDKNTNTSTVNNTSKPITPASLPVSNQPGTGAAIHYPVL